MCVNNFQKLIFSSRICFIFYLDPLHSYSQLLTIYTSDAIDYFFTICLVRRWFMSSLPLSEFDLHDEWEHSRSFNLTSSMLSMENSPTSDSKKSMYWWSHACNSLISRFGFLLYVFGIGQGRNQEIICWVRARKSLVRLRLLFIVKSRTVNFARWTDE